MIIDVTRLVGRTLKGFNPTGIDRVCIEYLRHFQTSTKTSIYLFNRLWIFNEKFSSLLIDALINQDREKLKKLIPISLFNLSNSRTSEIFINVSHSGGLDSPNYSKVIKRLNLNAVFMVHDLIPIEHPELARPEELSKHKIRLKNILDTHALIIVNSERTKQRLIKYAVEKYKIPVSEDKILVNYLGFSSKLAEAPDVDFNFVKEKYGLKDEYFVVLSTIEPRKNHLILFYAWKSLYRLLKDKTPQLVLIGRRGWESEQVIDFIERSNISKFIKELSSCTDSELKTILKNSQALLMPSLEEGFGLPVLEALMLDVLTVCSNIPVFKELFKDIPIYCSWSDATEWIKIVLKIISGKKDEYLALQKQKYSKNIQTIRKYTWIKHFKRLEELLIKNRLIKNENIFQEKGGLDIVFNQ